MKRTERNHGIVLAHARRICRGPRQGRQARPGDDADQQGYRAASAGAAAVPRSAGEPAQGLPVRERRRRQGPQIRHSGAGRGARRAPRKSTRWACAASSPTSRMSGSARCPTRSRRSQVETGAMPGGRHHGRRTAPRRLRARPAADPDLDAGLRQRALHHRRPLGHQGPGNRDAQSRQLPRHGEGRRPHRRPARPAQLGHALPHRPLARLARRQAGAGRHRASAHRRTSPTPR